MRKTLIAAALATLTLPSAAAFADPPPWAPAHGYREHEHHRHRSIYDSRGRYIHPRAITRRDYVWRDRDGHYHCRRDDGSTGLVIGAAVGALAGHELAGRGDKTIGTILGAVGGGLLGRAIDRGDLQCR